MFDVRYEAEYEQAIKDLKEAMVEYNPFFEAKDKWLGDEEMAAGEKLELAQKRWRGARRKYFGLRKDEL